MIVARLDFDGRWPKALGMANRHHCDVRMIERVGPSGHMVVEFSGVIDDMLPLLNEYNGVNAETGA